MDKRDLINNFMLTANRRLADIFGNENVIEDMMGINGPRAGSVVMQVRQDTDAGPLLKQLSEQDCALIRQWIPTEWNTPQRPVVYFQGRFVRIDINWPNDLAVTSIRVSDLNPRLGRKLTENTKAELARSPYWILGQSDTGQAIVCRLSDDTPHWLIAGATGSGKTITLRSAIVQLSHWGAQLVLIDGKPYASSLREFDKLPGVIGPVAWQEEDVLGALTWIVGEMNERFKTLRKTPPLVVFIDEVQQFSENKAIIGCLEDIVKLGREVGVHAVIATQKPINAAFNSAIIKANAPGRIALRVMNQQESFNIVGNYDQHAELLAGKGDSWVVTNQAIRVQVALVDEEDISLAQNWTFESWPAVPITDRASAGGGSGGMNLTPIDLAVGLIGAVRQRGRPYMQELADRLGQPIASNARPGQLKELMSQVLVILEDEGLVVNDASGQGKNDVVLA